MSSLIIITSKSLIIIPNPVTPKPYDHIIDHNYTSPIHVLYYIDVVHLKHPCVSQSSHAIV